MKLEAIDVPRIFDAHKALVGVAYVAAYVLLDFVSFIEPYAPFGITPWNPNTGLSFVLILRFGPRMIPWLFVSPLAADLVNRQDMLPWPIEILSTVLIGGGYSAALMFLNLPKLGFDSALSSMRDLVLLMLVAAVSAAFVASSYVGLAIAAGSLSATDFAAATLRYWVGDVIGILGVAPLTLFALARRRILPISIETALQLAAIVGALVLLFGFAEEREFQLFYVLFLPIIWMAVRTGTEGASIGTLLVQLGVILGVLFLPEERQDLTALQAMMLVLTVTGLVVGELVAERWRAESQLRMHQASLARLTRLGSIGELAAAVSHEVNQPLMAAGTYTRLVVDQISSGNADCPAVRETANKAVEQVDRAAEVIRRLRALVRLDRTNRATCPLERIIEETIKLCQSDLDRVNVLAQFKIAAGLAPVMVDVLQIEQVLLNLLRNSIEAIAAGGRLHGSVRIEAQPAESGFVEIHVTDSGPGFPRDHLENVFLPLSSDKAEGLGIGLSLSRSIVEAHGGRLWLEADSGGGSVRFTLPVAKEIQ
jgi:two-component system sensor kinase FixL